VRPKSLSAGPQSPLQRGTLLPPAPPQQQLPLPADLPLGAGAEVAQVFATRLEALRAERVRLGGVAKRAEAELFADDARCRALAAEWRLLTAELATALPAVAAGLAQLRARADALLEAAEVIEAAITLETEAVVRADTAAAVERARGDAALQAARREKELARLRTALDEAVARMRAHTEAAARLREESGRQKLQDAFERAAIVDIENYRRFGTAMVPNPTPSSSSSSPPPPLAAATSNAATSPLSPSSPPTIAEHESSPLQEDTAALEAFLSRADIATAPTSSPPVEAATTATTTTTPDATTPTSPRVLGDIDVSN